MTLIQNRKKLALKVFNYSMLDKLDQPLEYRINQQLRARSAETMYVRNPADFWEPIEVGRVHQTSIYPYPIEYTKDGETFIRIQTPILELASYWESRTISKFEGLIFEGMVGGRLSGYLTSHDPITMENSLKPEYIAKRRLRHDEILNRVNRTYGEILHNLISNKCAQFVYYHAANRRITEAFEQILKYVNKPDYLTIKKKLQKTSQRFNNAYDFYFVHNHLIGEFTASLEI